jgi:membrane protease YdiL (CAAX protease family)
VSRETTTAPRSGSLSLALSCIAAWLVAAACARLIGIWLAIGVTSAVLGIAVFVLDRPSAGKLLRPSPALILLGVASGGVMALATRLAYPVVSRRLPFIVTDTARLYASFRAPSSFIAIAALAPIILGEELVWRGVVQTSLVQRLGRAGGVALAALAYGLAHLPFGSPVLVAVAVGCGLAWGGLREMAKSLVPALVAHLVWDVLVLLWLPLDSR